VFSTRRPASRSFALGALLFAAVVAAYALSLRGDFLWDDDLHITANPTIIGPLGLREIWTTARANYFPLVLTNFWVQHALWNLNPLGFHAVTLGCHALAAVLLWRVLLALRVPGAWLGAALWALHPVQVESVAWICELKNTQSAVFFLAAVLCWLRWVQSGEEAGGPGADGAGGGSRSRGLYALALICSVAAILSKPSAVMLPVALALATWWMRRKVGWRDALALAPCFALSALAAGWTIWEQKHHSGAIGPAWSQTFPERVGLAGRVIWFYLGKLAWPEPLIFIYPRWQLSGAGLPGYLAPLGVAAGLLVLLPLRRGLRRAVGLAAVYFIALLFPVLGFFSIYFFRYSFVGDHFQYLASMGPLALAGAGLALLGPRRGAIAGTVVLLALTCVTMRQSRAYLSSETLWRDTLAKNPGTPMAWLNLADYYARMGRYDESMRTYRAALKVSPDDPDGYNDLGNVLALTGHPAEAAVEFEHALRLKPDSPETHSNLGNVLRTLGRSPEAVAHYRRALELKPDHVEALNNLGAELAESGRPDEALPLFQAALRLDPKHAGAHDNLGSAFRSLGRVEESLAEHREALRLNPDFAAAEGNLGRSLVAARRPAEALPHFERALALKPTLAAARGAYATALAASGRPDEAFAQLQKAVDLSPEAPDAHLNLGTALAQSGRMDDATQQFEAAVRLSPRFALARVNLAGALGSAGRWAEAIPHLRVALELQPDNARAQAQLAVALVNAGQLKEAIPIFERALVFDPNSAELHHSFGQLLGALGRNREAFEHMEKAADLQRAARK
jgi:protein O-mannosyl-transferase